MVGIHTQAVSEVLVIGEKMGVEKEMMFEILNASFAQSRIFDRHYTNFISKNQFQAGFSLKLLYKDLSLVEKRQMITQFVFQLGHSSQHYLRKLKIASMQMRTWQPCIYLTKKYNRKLQKNKRALFKKNQKNFRIFCLYKFDLLFSLIVFVVFC